MDSRLTAKVGPSIASPALRFSNVLVITPSLNLISIGPDGPAAAGTDHFAVLVEEHVVVHHEQPFALHKLVERAGMQGDDVVGTCRNIVAPGLPGIDGARRAHP